MALETILLAVGPSDADRLEELASAVSDVAGPTGATVVLLHVFSREDYREVRDQLDTDPDSEFTPTSAAQRQATIRELTGAFDDAGVDYEIRGAVGDKGEEIVDAADEVGADMVFVGGRQRSPTGKAVFGSTAQEVMLSAPCPVTFVRAGD